MLSFLLLNLINPIHTQISSKDFLLDHNVVHVVGVESLIWNQITAFYVEDYANISAVDCVFNYSMEPYGENISKVCN